MLAAFAGGFAVDQKQFWQPEPVSEFSASVFAPRGTRVARFAPTAGCAHGKAARKRALKPLSRVRVPQVSTDPTTTAEPDLVYTQQALQWLAWRKRRLPGPAGDGGGQG